MALSIGVQRPSPGVLSLTSRRTRLWVALAVVAGKLAVFLGIYLAYNLLPFFSANFLANFVDRTVFRQGIARAFSTWDAQHYLFLSESGYHAGQSSDAFFPLFPLLIHLATPLFHDSLVSGLVVANVASVLGLCLLFELVTRLCSGRIARTTLLLYLAFPTAFFFSLVYSESVFLLLIVGFFYLLLVERRLDLAALPAALLPLARPEGALVILPLAVYYLIDVAGWGRTRPVRIDERALYVLSPLVGVGAYLAFMRAATGNALEMLAAMRGYVSAHSLTYLLHPPQLVQALFGQPLALHGFTNSMIDRAVFALFLALLWPMFRRVHASLASYALAAGLLNVLSGTFMSYSRYVLLAFPAFIAAAILLDGRRSRWAIFPISVFLMLFQGIFLTMHALSYWVA